MTRHRFVSTAVAVALFPLTSVAYEPSAMNMDGRVLHTSEKKPGPWHADLVKHDWGEYPLEARNKHQEGIGWFRLELRPDGSVASVKVMQSTGTSTLDEAAIAAFRRWLFKPGKWKWVDEPMWFKSDPPAKKMSSHFIRSTVLPSDAVELAADEHPDMSDYYQELPKTTPVSVPLGYKPVRVFQIGRFIGWTYMSEESIAELHSPE